jgi:hypothetical protein
MKFGHDYVKRRVNMTDDFLWLLGLFVAEGMVFRDGKKTYKIAVSSDEEFVFKAKRIFEEVFDIQCTFVRNKTGAPTVYKNSEVLCNFFDQWGLYYRSGAIDRAAFMRVNSGIVLGFWELLAPVVALLADPVRGNLSFQQFEYLAVQARRWQERHPAGDYPKGEQRMPLVDRFSGLDER